MLYCVNLLEKPIKKKGNSKEKCVFDYTDKPFLHFMLFSFGERGLCWTLNSDSDYKSMSSTVDFFFFHMRVKGCVRECVCLHSFALKREPQTATFDGSEWVEVQSYAGPLLSPPLRCIYNVKV